MSGSAIQACCCDVEPPADCQILTPNGLLDLVEGATINVQLTTKWAYRTYTIQTDLVQPQPADCSPGFNVDCSGGECPVGESLCSKFAHVCTVELPMVSVTATCNPNQPPGGPIFDTYGNETQETPLVPVSIPLIGPLCNPPIIECEPCEAGCNEPGCDTASDCTITAVRPYVRLRSYPDFPPEWGYWELYYWYHSDEVGCAPACWPQDDSGGQGVFCGSSGLPGAFCGQYPGGAINLWGAPEWQSLVGLPLNAPLALLNNSCLRGLSEPFPLTAAEIGAARSFVATPTCFESGWYPVGGGGIKSTAWWAEKTWTIEPVGIIA